jgi:hypothetical protein
VLTRECMVPDHGAHVATIGAMTWNVDATIYDTVRAPLERRSTLKYEIEPNCFG